MGSTKAGAETTADVVPAPRRRIAPTVAWDPNDAQQPRANAAIDDRDDEPMPRTIARYIVLQRLGRGGMGVVYSAYDNELERKVAIKLVSAHDDAKANARMRREALALAKLSHPNVVQLFEVGRHCNDMFVVMEHIRGETLRQWTRAGGRRWQDIVAVYLQAGLGLAAAHHAGLVHRDFKPDNAMLDQGGRVRVVDFGLARPAHDSDGGEAGEAHIDPSAAAEPLTRTGAVLGTPAYMAPEQFPAGVVDARCDQFAFCVALCEALYGKRPFAGRAPSQASARVTGESAQLPKLGRVPTWVADVLRRGLELDPRERYASMDALLAALARDPASRRRRLWVWGGASVLTTAALSSWLTIPLAASAPRAVLQPPCVSAHHQIESVWGDHRRAALRQTFTSMSPRGGEIASEVIQTLDDYTAHWISGHQAACEATHVLHEQSSAVLDARMACLNRRQRELEGVLGLLLQADTATTERAVDVVDGLSTLETCANLDNVNDRVRPPNSRIRQGVDETYSMWARTRTLDNAGKLDEALAVATKVLVRARELEHPPLLADALGSLSHQQLRVEAVDDALPTLREAFVVGIASHEDGVAFAAARTLAGALARDPTSDEAMRWAEVAFAYADRLAPVVSWREADLQLNVGEIYLQRGDHTRALERFQAGHAAAMRGATDHPGNLADTNLALARAYAGIGRTNAAHAHATVGLEIAQSALADPIRRAEALRVYARIMRSIGRPSAAARAAEQALEIAQGHFGEDHFRVTRLRAELAGAWREAGDDARALALTERQQHGGDAVAPEQAARLLLERGRLALLQGRHAQAASICAAQVVAFKLEAPSRTQTRHLVEALACVARARLAWHRRGHGRTHLHHAQRALHAAQQVAHSSVHPNAGQRAELWLYAGQLQRRRGNLDEALLSYARGLARAQEVKGSHHPLIARLWTARGEALHAKRAFGPATDALKHAIGLLVDADTRNEYKSRARRALAECLHSRGLPKRAQAMAELADIEANGAPQATTVARGPQR